MYHKSFQIPVYNCCSDNELSGTRMSSCLCFNYQKLLHLLFFSCNCNPPSLNWVLMWINWQHKRSSILIWLEQCGIDPSQYCETEWMFDSSHAAESLWRRRLVAEQFDLWTVEDLLNKQAKPQMLACCEVVLHSSKIKLLCHIPPSPLNLKASKFQLKRYLWILPWFEFVQLML